MKYRYVHPASVHHQLIHFLISLSTRKALSSRSVLHHASDKGAVRYGGRHLLCNLHSCGHLVRTLGASQGMTTGIYRIFKPDRFFATSGS